MPLAIERTLTEDPISSKYFEEEDVDVEILNPEAVSVETEDGGMLIDFRPEAEQRETEDFHANLAESMEDRCLERLSSDLMGAYLSDRSSRKDWEESYAKGLDELGLKLNERTTLGPAG